MASDLVHSLQESGAEFVAAAQSVGAAQAASKPAPERWSVLDCIEHVVASESTFVGWLQMPQSAPGAPPPVAPPQDKEKEAMLAKRLPNRTTRVKAPERAEPKGRFKTLDEALGEFQATRSRTIQFAEEKGDGLYSLSAHHAFFGPVNGAEVIVLLDGHCRRHAAQMREIKEELGSDAGRRWTKEEEERALGYGEHGEPV